MELGAFKPLIKALLLPPTGLLLLTLLGLMLAARRRLIGQVLGFLGLASLWLLSCNAVALRLSDALVPQPPAASFLQLKTAKVQAIVILGGGLDEDVAEYGGTAQPSRDTAERIRYAMTLARQLQLPVAYAGGVGWLRVGSQSMTEGAMARRHLLEQYGVTLRWVDDKSRDTVENAKFISPMLRGDGIERIALVTNAWHMPRALDAFKRETLTVIPAPMGYLRPQGPTWHEWLPSPRGMRNSYIVLHEWLGLLASKF